MKNKIKSLLAVAVLGSATLGLYSGSGFADTNTATASTEPVTVAASAPAPKPHHRFHHCGFMHRHHGKSPWHLGLNRDKKLTVADARIITEAALLMRGHHDLQVGTVNTKITKHGRKLYVIDIVNASNKMVTRIVLNSKNGHIFPMHMHHAQQA